MGKILISFKQKIVKTPSNGYESAGTLSLEDVTNYLKHGFVNIKLVFP